MQTYSPPAHVTAKRKSRARAYHIANREKILARSKAWALANPDKRKQSRHALYLSNRQKSYEQTKAWRLAHPKKMVEYVRKWQKRNPEKTKSIYRNWVKNNPDARRVTRKQSNHKRKAQMHLTNYEDCTAKIRLLGRERFCHWCCTPLTDENRTIDHIIPLARGGHHISDNLAASCATCNFSRGDKLISEWLPAQEFAA